jgi:hypothetical protein
MAATRIALLRTRGNLPRRRTASSRPPPKRVMGAAPNQRGSTPLFVDCSPHTRAQCCAQRQPRQASAGSRGPDGWRRSPSSSSRRSANGPRLRCARMARGQRLRLPRASCASACGAGRGQACGTSRSHGASRASLGTPRMHYSRAGLCPYPPGKSCQACSFRTSGRLSGLRGPRIDEIASVFHAEPPQALRCFT